MAGYQVKAAYQLSERDILKAILQYLKLHRIFHFRMNTGAFAATYKGKRHFVRFGTLGGPDIVAIHKGIIYGIEVKGPEGIQSQHQFEFEKEFTKAGGRYVLARSIEHVHLALG